MSHVASFVARIALLCTLAVPGLATAATFTVTNGNNAGTGSLRAAITAANADASGTLANPHIINFSGVSTVTLTTTLPFITRPVYLNVFASEVRLHANTLIDSSALRFSSGAGPGSIVQNISIRCSNPVPCFGRYGIELVDNGSTTTQGVLDLVTVDGVGLSGIRVEQMNLLIDRSVVVRAGLAASGNRHGIQCNGVGVGDVRSKLTLTRSRVGITANGTAAGNTLDGVNLRYCLFSQIGGDAADAGNVISANGRYGVRIDQSNSTRVQGNMIGLDATGALARPNQWDGVHVLDSNSVVIGGDSANLGNTISANGGSTNSNISVSRQDVFATHATIRHNRIGVRADGTLLPLGASTRTGIVVSGAATALIGGVGQGNIIADHNFHGVSMGSGATALIRNSIYANGLTGINDGGNQPVPVLAPVIGNSIISGTVPGGASDGRVEFYVDDWDQGQLYVGEVNNFQTVPGGVEFATAINLSSHVGRRLTATYWKPAVGQTPQRSGAFAAPVPIGQSILSVNLVAATGSERVTSTPSNIDCPGFCTGGYNGGSTTLTAFPNANRQVTWSGACSGSGTCTVNMNQNRSVTATFAPVQRTLAVSRVGDGTVTSTPAGINCGATCTASYTHGTNVTLSATPGAAHTFSHWSGACTGSGQCVVAMTAARNVTATFQPILRTVTVNRSGQGTVTSNPAGINCGSTCAADFLQGSGVTLTVTPAQGWMIGSVTGCNFSGNTCTLNVGSAGNTVNVTFIPTRSVNVTVVGQGTVTSNPAGINCGATCSASFPDGSQVSLIWTPAPNWVFAGWSGDCSGSLGCSLNMSANRNVTATFVPVQHMLRVMFNGGTGSATSTPAGIDCVAICEADFDHGTVVQLQVVPAPGFQFSHWEGACEGSGTCQVVMDQFRGVMVHFVPATTTHTLTVVRNGQGTVTSNPAGIDCGATCSAAFNSGTSVTLTATPAAGWQFSGWGGICTGTGTCVVSMTQARNVTATFTELPPQQFSLTVSRVGQGTVTSNPAGIDCGATCSAAFNSDTSVTLTPTPTAGWLFSGWSGACAGSGACVVGMTQARSVTATFTELPPQQFSLTVSRVGQGTVTSNPAGIDCGATCSAAFNSGTSVTLTPTPATGWLFSGWSGACTGSGACVVGMTQARTVTATFTELPPQQFSLAVSRVGQGTVTSNPAGIDCGATCSAAFNSGTSVTLTPTPTAGWQFSGWSGACTGSGACVVSMTQARSVTATFVQDDDILFASGFDP